MMTTQNPTSPSDMDCDLVPSAALSVWPLIDTHTHFDEEIFAKDRNQQIKNAQESGVCHLLLIGYLRQYFQRMWSVQSQINRKSNVADATLQSPPRLQAHVALGLHPFYIDQHTDEDLHAMWQRLIASADHPNQRPIAIGEVGLDTYLPELKQPAVFAKQKHFFIEQLDMAVQHSLPVLLHIRKAHADCLQILKQHDYDAKNRGGIAHSFSGGEQEAKAFVKLGFKLGVTGQVTNPNAKKLRRALHAAVAEYGLGCLVIETDCPDMTPIACQHLVSSHAGNEPKDRNVPANLPQVLMTLSEMFQVPLDKLSKQLWQNSCEALKVNWPYPCLDA